MTGLLLLLGIALAALWLWAVLHIAWMLTHPPRRTYASAVARGRPGEPSELPGRPRRSEAWTFTSRGVELPVWEIEGDRADGPAVILSHCWADSRIGGLARVAALAPLASRLVLWDAPGHGEAPGVCRLGTAEVDDLLALVERVGGASTVLYGWSMGAGMSIAAARRHRGIAAVVAESPYRLADTPARNVLRARGMPHRAVLGPALALVDLVIGGGLGRSKEPGGRGVPFDRREQAAGVTCPLLVLHGELDEVCPLEDGRAIAAAAPRGSLAAIPGGGHNDLWTDPALAARCAEALHRFLPAAVETPAPGTYTRP